MAKFSSQNQPAKGNNGRPTGSKNKRSQFSDVLTTKAIGVLTEALDNNEAWAVETVLKRTHPSLKAITPLNSIDHEYLSAKIFEIQDLEHRLNALEALPRGR